MKYRCRALFAIALFLAAPFTASATVGKSQTFEVNNPLQNRVWATLYVQTLLNPRTIVSAKWANPGKLASFVSDTAGAYWMRVEVKKLGDEHLSGNSCWLSQT